MTLPGNHPWLTPVRHWVSLRTVLIWVIAILAIVAVGVGTEAGLGPGSPSALHAQSCLLNHREFHAQGLTFDYPSCFIPHTYTDVSSFTASIVELSNEATHPPCRRLEVSGVVGDVCSWPMARLGPGGVLIDWIDFGFPSWSIRQDRGTRLIVDGRPASEQISTPGACGDLGADETVLVDIANSANASGGYRMQACLRGPDLMTQSVAITRMVESVRISSAG
jgi:hypothetical protein